MSSRVPSLEDRDPVEHDVAHPSRAGAEESSADEVDHVDPLVLDAVQEIRFKGLLRVARAPELEIRIEERDWIVAVRVFAREAGAGELGVHGRGDLFRKANGELGTAPCDRADVKPLVPGVVSGIPVVPCEFISHRSLLYHIGGNQMSTVTLTSFDLSIAFAPAASSVPSSAPAFTDVVGR